MSEKSWDKTFICSEDEYNILLKALYHYKKRLEKIHSEDTIKKLGGSFAMMLQTEANNTLPHVQKVITIIESSDPYKINTLMNHFSLIEKALRCYQADIQKIEETMKERYDELFDEPKKLKEDLPAIAEALKKINQFS